MSNKSEDVSSAHPPVQLVHSNHGSLIGSTTVCGCVCVCVCVCVCACVCACMCVCGKTASLC